MRLGAAALGAPAAGFGVALGAGAGFASAAPGAGAGFAAGSAGVAFGSGDVPMFEPPVPEDWASCLQLVAMRNAETMAARIVGVVRMAENLACRRILRSGRGARARGLRDPRGDRSIPPRAKRARHSRRLITRQPKGLACGSYAHSPISPTLSENAICATPGSIIERGESPGFSVSGVWKTP